MYNLVAFGVVTTTASENTFIPRKRNLGPLALAAIPPCIPLPQAAVPLLLSVLIFPIWTCHLNRIVWHTTLVWRVPRFVHCVACVLLHFFCCWIILPWRDLSHIFIHSLVDGHLGCPHSLVNVNNVAVSGIKHVSFWWMFLSAVCESQFSALSLHLLLSVSCVKAILVAGKWYLLALVYISRVTWMLSTFSCLLAMCISSLEKCPFKLFAHFYLGYYPFVWSWRSSLFCVQISYHIWDL